MGVVVSVVTYTNSIRVKKARFGNHIHKRTTTIVFVVSLLIVAIGIFMITQEIQLGLTLIGLALVPTCFVAWVKWDISNVGARVELQPNGDIALDKVLSADIVGLLNDKMTPRQIWSAIHNHWEVKFILLRYEIGEDSVSSVLSDSIGDSMLIWHTSVQLVGQMPISEVTAGVILTSIIVSNPKLTPVLNSLALDTEDIVQGLRWQESLLRREIEPKKSALFGGIGRDWASGFTPILDRFGHNISLDIQKGNQDFSGVARGRVLEQMAHSLARENRGSIALVGDTGVGKKQLVFSLAELMIRGESEENLRYKQIVQIDPTIITSSISENSRLETIFEQIFYDSIKAGNIILFFDEAQLFFSNEPGTVNIAKVLLPILEKYNLNCILAINHQEWHKITSTDPALAQMFTRVEVEPTDEVQTISILQDFAIIFESKYKRAITFKALKESYLLSERYLRDAAQPKKSINLLEDSCNYPDNGLITENSVRQAVEIIANVKVEEGSVKEKNQLLNLESLIHRRMINQSRAVQVVSDALRRSRAGVRNENRPVGSFLFLGPTGVGKTELAKSLAQVYFGGEKNIIRLDMSEYQTTDDVHRFLSAADTDSKGSTLLQEIAQKPFTVVLFDEIEKANPDILDLLLQLLDEGELTDDSGKKVSFKEAIVICTSNAGADEIRSKIESGQALEQFEKQFVDDIINQHLFKPELINRFDEVVLFRPLNKEELLQVAYLLIKSVNMQLEKQKISISLTEAAYQFLVESGYDPRLGARPMRRAVQRLVENTMAKKILSGSVQKGSQITLDVKDFQG
ncbi:MAG: ATP-dependent Clp protease ATP-binding subunit ClpC [Patescibacteria group bacterium]|jgi:ATP-dependent Clp protease ATP-binding subunit ClpC|nr:ATP-dependent Clp protease ATP-binding subunit ClpC [Patescibacteria group bacterium]